MKIAIVSVLATGFSLAAACSSSTTSSSTQTDGGSDGSAASTGSSSGTTTGTTSGTSGSTSSGGSSTSSSSGGVEACDGGEGCDCTVTPCGAPMVCCPTVNQCTPADMMDCASNVWVACTKASDCTGGKVCCVTAATTTGSGPSGSECKTACDYTGSNPDQGPACNIQDPNGGVGDCPANQGWLQCDQVSNSPASLGVCLCASGIPADCAKGEVKDSGSKD